MSSASGNKIGGIEYIPTNKPKEKELKKCWSRNFSEQFPTDSETISGNKLILRVSVPHEGYSIEVELKHNGSACKAQLLSDKMVTVAIFTMVNNVANGPCELFDIDGNLIYKGNFVDGYLQGRVKEYDPSGHLVYDGFFMKGKKQNNIKRSEQNKDYWEEREGDKLISYCKKNRQGENDGICCFFENNRIQKINLCKDGHPIETLKEFNGEKMTEYQDGKKVYEGGYLNDLQRMFPRNGLGTEYSDDGKTIVYNGTYKRGKRHGSGTLYISGTRKRSTKYLCGHRRNGCIISIALLAILVIAIIVLVVVLCVRKKSVEEESCSITKDVLNFYVKKNSCNSNRNSLHYWSPSSESNVRTIDIGDDSFRWVKEVQIDGLNELKTLKIGKNSFTQKRNHFGNDQSKSFHLMNCKSLEWIKIGEYSFSDFAGDFELKNLSSLESIIVGTVGSESENFYVSSFTVRGRKYFTLFSV